MSLLTASLLRSRLLGPAVALATLPGERLHAWLHASRLGQIGSRLLPTTGASRFAWAKSIFPWALTLGVSVLFWLQTWQETGIIGAAAGGLLFLVLIAGLLFRPALRLNAVDLIVLAFLASAVLSTAFSSYVLTSAIGLGKWLTFIAGYVVFRIVSETSRGRLPALLAVLALLALIQSGIGFYQFINHIEPLATWSDPTVNAELQMNRIFGTLKPANPNLLAGFLIPCFAAAVGLLLMSLTRLRRWTPLLTILFLGASGAILAAIVLTGSRGGYLALAGMSLTLFGGLGHLVWHHAELPKRRVFQTAWLVLLVVSVLGVAGAIAGSPKIQARVASIFAMREDSSISYRLNVYQSATQMFLDNPIVGIGPGNGTFKQVYGLYMIPGFNALGAYSVPLEIAVEQGIIGLAVFAVLLLTLALRAGLYLDSDTPSLRDKILVLALLTGIVGSIAYGVFDTIWYRPSVNLLFWFFVAALATLTEPPTTATLEDTAR